MARAETGTVEAGEKADEKRIHTLQRELDWIHMSPRARQAKGKARVSAYEKLLSQDVEKRREDMQIYIPPGPRLGDIVIDFTDVSKSFGERLLYEPPWHLNPSRRYGGYHRTERCRQNDIDQDDYRDGATRYGQCAALAQL